MYVYVCTYVCSYCVNNICSYISILEKMPEGFKEKVDELAGHMFNMMWSLTQMDIESTLGKT